MRNKTEFWTLAIHRIVKLQLLDEVFPDDHSFSQKEFLKSRFGLFSGKPEKIKLKFNKFIRHYIDRKRWHATQKISSDKKGNLILEMDVAISPELISWIMSWHKFVKVIKPKSLVQDIRSNLEQTIGQY